MSSPPIYLSIEPRSSETRLLFSVPSLPWALRARLPSAPSHPRALITLLESLSLWLGAPLHAVVDADAEDVRLHPEKWAVLLGDAPELAVHVEWASVPTTKTRDRFLGRLGNFHSGARLLAYGVTGQR